MPSDNDEKKSNSEDTQNLNSGQKRKREAVDDGYASSDEEGNDSDVEEASDLDSEEDCNSESSSGTESDDDDDEEGESDDDEEGESDDDECSSSPSVKEFNSTKEVESEDSSPETVSREICAICLSYMKGEIGSPELCDHSFCLECILEWARTNNSCPQDRTQFLQVFVRKKVKGKIIRTIKVEEVKPDDIPDDDEEEPTFCEVCGRCDREDSLLLCDGCDSGHHLECLSPPLNSVPIEEWYCNECQAVDRLSNRRTRNQDVIELEEVTSLIDEAGVETCITADRSIRPATVSRRVPRTRASERIRRRIQRVRNTREETYHSLEIEEEEDSEEEVEVEVSTSSSKSATKPARKKRKVTIRRKRKTKRKVVKRKTKTGTKKKTKKKTTKKKGSATKKKRRTKSTKKKGTKKRKSTTKKRGAKWRKRKGKKKPKPQVVITPKARLAEALGIRPLKNPWQLSLPAMTGGRSQEGASLTNQRWKAGVPSLSLLGSNSELDYLSEPDEFGDAILVAGVARRRQSTTEALARRKAMAVEVLSRVSYPAVRNLDSLPVNDSSVSSMGDLLDNIIQSQSMLHKTPQKVLNQKDNSTSVPKDQQGLAKQVGTGPDSPGKEGNNQVKTPPRDQNRNGQPRFIYGVYSTAKVADAFSNNTSVPRNPNDEDPTGSKAYSSYLRDHTHPDKIPLPESSNKDNKKPRKEDRKKKLDEDEVNLYSDIEPEISEDNEEESDEVDDQANAKLQEHHEENDSPLSGDELVIDDTREKALTNRSLSAGTSGENEVGSSNLPGLNDFELEAVSDTDTHEMDKSMNSSISLSDSNMGDAEVTSSTNEINVAESEHRNSSNRMIQLYNSTTKSNFEAVTNQSIGMGLEGLETETISDNEEICFEDNYGNDDDNIEEGEIPNENAPRALPSNRPKINIQLRRVIEVSSPNKEFEGECEEGEIIDESAAKREKKREKAKRDVEEVVNQQLDEEIKENGEKENGNPDVNTQLILHSEVEINVPEKVLIPPDDMTLKLKDKKEKQAEKDKDKEKEKDKTKDKPREKDIAFKKVSRNTKVRNYRDNDKDIRYKRRGSRERSHSRDRGYSRERDYSRERGRTRERNRDAGGGHSGDRYRRRDKDRKKEPKRKEMERYNVRQMINKKEEERKKKDEFGRDVSMREVRPSKSRSRSHSKSKGRRRRRSDSRSKKATSAKNKDKFRKSFSRSRSKSRNLSRSRKRRRSSYSSSSSSSSSTSSSSSSSSYSSSSSSSSRSRSRSRRTRDRKRLSKSRSKSLTKKIEKKKIIPPKPKEKVKKVVVSPQKKKVEEKKKEKRKEKEDPKIEKPKKKKKRDKTPLQSKEVYQAGGSIMVSVNFSRNTAKENKDPKKKKDKEVKVDDLKKKKKGDKNSGSSPYHPWSPHTHSGSPVGKHTPLQDEPMWSPDTLHHQTRVSENAKSPEVIDLDVIMVTPPPQEPILISDSEEEEEGITRLPPDLGMQQCSPITRNQGPKTPPEPGVKFTLSTKQALKPITNPLRDEEEEDHSVPVPSRGPNTPPGPPPESDESVGRPKSPIRRMPRSPVGTPPVSSPEPDVYDPFEPTKSPSPPTRSPQQEARVSSSDQTDQILLKSPGIRSPSKSVSSPPPPPPPSDPPQSEDRPPEPQKAPEDEASSTAPTQPATVTIPTSAPPPPIIPHTVAAPPNQIVTSLPGVISLSTSAHTLPPITTHTNSQPLNQMQQIFAGLPANVANILYPAALAAAAMRGAAANTLLRPPNSQPLVPPDFSRPPPVTPGMLSRPPPISPLKTGKITQNGQNAVDIVDMDLGSPTSPDSSDVSDMFEPPSPLNIVSQEKTSPRKPKPTPQKISPTKQGKHLDKFDALFGSNSESRTKTTPHKSKPSLNSKLSKMKNLGGKKSEHDEDIPSSAVDLQVKERLLKKVQRQERVVDEVKLCLKPFYNKKTINKEDYKDIMKRCVQKVCHNKSGEINPNKIRSLVEGYIKKVKYYRKKHGTGGAGGILSQIKSGTVLPPTVNDPPPPGFALKSHMKLKP